MTPVPHSGNYCSGMCRTPCDHPDCWQCSEYKDLHPEGAAVNQRVNKNWPPSNQSYSERLLQSKKDKQRAEQRAALEHHHAAELNRRQAEGSILSGMGAQREMDQKTVITRAALEALAERAGIRMDWNGGEPVFYDDGTGIAARAEAIRRTLSEERAKSLTDIASKLGPKDILTERVAKTMAEAAIQSIDNMVSDTLRSKTDELLRHDAEENEQKAIAKLKEAGASDADIEAAKALMGWRPDQSQFRVSDAEELAHIAGLQDLLTGSKPELVTTTFSKEVMRTMMKKLEASLITPKAVLVHPSMLDINE